MPLNETVREAAAEAQRTLRKSGANVKWVEGENLHFTLKFLGDTPVSRVPELLAVGREVANRTAPIQVRVRGLGSFPPQRPPQVIWAGCGEGAEAFAALGRDLDTALAAAELAEPDQRPFMPHLTLGRVRGCGNLSELAECLQQAADLELGAMVVERFLLISSELGRGGPTYTTVESFEVRR